jgi:hypothetical protein
MWNRCDQIQGQDHDDPPRIIDQGNVRLLPTESYISVLRNNKKFAIVQVTSSRMDIGIKLKGVLPKGRLEASGTWKSMVTHRVRIDNPKQLNAEVITWLQQAYQDS